MEIFPRIFLFSIQNKPKNQQAKGKQNEIV